MKLTVDCFIGMRGVIEFGGDVKYRIGRNGGGGQGGGGT